MFIQVIVYALLFSERGYNNAWIMIQIVDILQEDFMSSVPTQGVILL